MIQYYTKAETDYLFSKYREEGSSFREGVKALNLTDTAPTTTGWYKPTVSGTYANAGGLVAQVGYDTLFYRDDEGNWSKVEVAMPSSVDTVTEGGTVGVNSKAVINYAQRIDIFPFKNKPVSEKQRLAADAVLELVVWNYDTTAKYYLTQFARNLDSTAYGWSGNEYIVKVKKVNSNGTVEVWKAREPNNLPVERIPQILNFEDKFSVFVDWTKFPEFQEWDVDEAPQYELSPLIGNQINAPRILQARIQKENNSGKNVFLFGAGANATPDGEYNLAIGKESMMNLGGAGYNVAIGYRSMKNHKTGAGNIAIGMDALLNSESVIDVTVVGWEAGKYMVSGVGDTGVGRRSLGLTTKAGGNTAFGDSTLYSIQYNSVNGDGGSNIAMGYTAGEYCVTLKNSILIGTACARNVTGGNNNVILGNQAMLNRSKASNANIAIGGNVMLGATGDLNVVIGSYTMNNNVDGNENTVVGYNAGNSLTNGHRNVLIGTSSGSGGTNVSDSIGIGANVRPNKDKQIMIGNGTETEFVICGVTFTKAQLQALKNLV